MPSPHTPAPAPSRGASPIAVPGGLKDTLDRLRGVLENLAGGAAGAGSALGSSGGFGLAGLGAGLGAGGLGLTARAGLAPAQAMARQVQQSLDATARSFASSLQQAQRSWKKNTAGFATDFFAAMNNTSRKRRGWGARSGRATRRAWQGSVAWARRTATAARKRATRWAKRSRRWATGTTWQVARMGRQAGAGLGRRRRRAGRGASAWMHRARGTARSWGRWGSRASRRWTRAANSWANSARRSYHRAARWAGRTRTRFSRNVGRRWRRFGRRSAVAWRRAGAAFSRTRSPGAAARAGLGALAGRGLTGGLGQFNIAVTALTAAMKALQSDFEGQNASNRRLSGYSGPIAAAFGQLALGDQQRNVKLARATEGSAVTLANLTNQSREIQGGFDRLSAGVGNRVASAQAVVWNGMMRPWSMAADGLTGIMNQFDPKGDLLARVAASPWSAAAGVGGFLGSLWGGSSTKEAWEASQRAFDQQEKDALAGVAPQLDPAAAFIANAQNQRPVRPARFVRP